MGETLQVVGLIGGALGAAVCVVMAMIRFKDNNTAGGVGLLVLTPVVFFVVYALTFVVLVGAVLAFVGWVFLQWLNE